MTVNASTRRAGPYVGTGVIVGYSFDFKVFAASDLRVVRAVIATGVTTDLVLDSDYSVSLNADQDDNPGGTVSYLVAGIPTALPTTQTLTIVGNLPFTQPTDITNLGGFYPQVIEDALDRQTMLVQQNADAVSRSLQLNVATSQSFDVQMPAPVAGSYLGWGLDGLSIVNYDGTSTAPVVAAALAQYISDVANASDVSKGDALVGAKYTGPNAVALNLHDWIEDDGSWNVMGWIPQNLKSAIRDRTSAADVDTYINLAITDLKNLRGAGTLKFPPGRFNLAAGIVGQQGVGISGAGMQATLFYNRGNSTVHAIVYGTGTTAGDADFEKVLLQGFSIIGSETSGRCFWGRKATTGFVIRDVYSEKGQNPWTLDSCYSLMMENVQVRDATVGHNIALNAITHDATLIQVSSQIARAGAGLYTTGCYTVRMIGGKLEFNQRDQALVDSGRGIFFRDVYVEGIQPTASGYAGIQVVAADTVTISGGLFDATQSGPMGTNGTGTYVKVSGSSSRVRFREYGFVSVAGTQTHVNFGASASNCEAVVPLGATYVNSSTSCRVYNDVHDERGVTVYNTATQAYGFGVWNGLTIDTEVYDAKSEWTGNQFTPKDHGVYSWDVIAGVQALATLKGAYLRLLNVTDTVEVAKVQYTNTGAAATTQVLSAHFKELLVAGKSYQVQLYLDDTANRNSVPGASTARQTIKRIS